MNAVFLTATHELGFREEDILVYGWSIGGYTASWLAQHYPNIKGFLHGQLSFDKSIQRSVFSSVLFDLHYNID